MISSTYIFSGVLLLGATILFTGNQLTSTTHAISWAIVFFIASAAASSAYLTVSEIFPVEIRASAIAIFYAIGTLTGGVGAPLLFGYLLESHSRFSLAYGYMVGAVLMMAAGVFAWFYAVDAERKSLESVNKETMNSGANAAFD